MGKLDLTPREQAALKTSDYHVTGWGQGGLRNGADKQVWYDKYGHEFILPDQPDMHKFRRGRGLSLAPPVNPEAHKEVDMAEAYIDTAEAEPVPEPIPSAQLPLFALDEV